MRDTVHDHGSPLVAPEAGARWLARLPTPVALTGGTGFVGSHLVDTLCAAGVTPRVLVRDRARARWIADRPVSWVEGDLGDAAALGRLVAGAGTVLHLAGVLRAAREGDFDLGHRGGTAAVVRAMAVGASGARLVHVSSQAALGPAPDPSGLGPEAEPRPISAYGRSKLAAERELEALPEEVRRVVVRPPAIYGPRDTDVLEFFRMAARGLTATPAGERWITVAHVADVVRGILAAAASGADRAVYHLGDPEPETLRRLLERIAAAGGLRPAHLVVPPPLVSALGLTGSLLHRLGATRFPMTRDKAREILARHWVLRTADSLAALGLGASVPFDAGATATWTWYRRHHWLRHKEG